MSTRPDRIKSNLFQTDPQWTLVLPRSGAEAVAVPDEIDPEYPRRSGFPVSLRKKF